MRSSWTRSGGGTASSVKHCDITCTAGSSNRPCDSTPPEPQSSVVPSYVTPRTAQPTVGFRIKPVIRRADCRSPIETSPASPIEMSRSTVGMRLVGVAWDDGDHDEPHRADASAGTDRHCRWTAIGGGRDGVDRGWAKTDLSSAGCISNSRYGRLDFAEAWPTQQPSTGRGVP